MRAALVVMFLAACIPAPGPQDAGSSPVTVRVMTWNARQLGADGGTSAAVAEQVAALHPDLVTLQELTSAAMLDDLVARLPGYEGRAGVLAAGSGGLLQAVLWKPDVLSVESVENIFTSGTEAAGFPRPPLVWKTTVTARSAQFKVVAVHLKAGARAADEQTRITALSTLEQSIHADAATLLLGDFNEALSDPRSGEAFAPFTGDRYRVQTLGLADAGVVTFLPAHLYFDHVVSTLALDAGTVTIPPLDTTVGGYLQNVSDHLPVVLDVTF